MESVLRKPTLVLNRNWRGIGIETVKESVKKMFTGSRLFLSPRTYARLGIEEWREMLDDEHRIGSIEDTLEGLDLADHHVIHFGKPDVETGECPVVVAPHIVLLTNYDDMPKNEVRLTRRNVLVRDKYRCQYCGVKVARPQGESKIRKLFDYTWDHVIPRSHGGKTTWSNIVTCCFKCNSKKRDRTPEDARMELLSIPQKPRWSLSLIKHISDKPECWNPFLSKDVWEEIEPPPPELETHHRR
jgi:5-methylcytosine-specific restriction endonuclease McrA